MNHTSGRTLKRLALPTLSAAALACVLLAAPHPAQARFVQHDATGGGSCRDGAPTAYVSAWRYNGATYSVRVDDIHREDGTFQTSLEKSWNLGDPTKAHTYRINIEASDDRDYNRLFQGTVPACVTPPTTTLPPTTTAPPSTTTVPPTSTSTTTAPPTSTTAPPPPSTTTLPSPSTSTSPSTTVPVPSTSPLVTTVPVAGPLLDVACGRITVTWAHDGPIKLSFPDVDATTVVAQSPVTKVFDEDAYGGSVRYVVQAGQYGFDGVLSTDCAAPAVIDVATPPTPPVLTEGLPATGAGDRARLAAASGLLLLGLGSALTVSARRRRS